MSTEKCYTAIQVRDDAQIRVVASEWKGHVLLHVREYYKKNGEYAPGRGIAIKSEHVGDLAYALRLAAEDKLEEVVGVGDG